MKKIISIIFVVVLVSCCSTFAARSYAYYVSKDMEENKFMTGSIDIENDENGFTDKTSWTGTETKKEVQIKNNSKSSALIRVVITPRWVNSDGTPFAGDTKNVKINYAPNTKWVKNDKDGYFYYSEIIPTGSKTDSIITSVSANIPESLKDRYKGKKLIVDVHSESVIATTMDTTDGAKEAVYSTVWKDINNKTITDMLDKLSGI